MADVTDTEPDFAARDDAARTCRILGSNFLDLADNACLKDVALKPFEPLMRALAKRFFRSAAVLAGAAMSTREADHALGKRLSRERRVIVKSKKREYVRKRPQPMTAQEKYQHELAVKHGIVPKPEPPPRYDGAVPIVELDDDACP